MHSILLLLFVIAPVVAALSLDIGGFVPFLLLFCLVAGLSTPPSAGRPGDRTSRKFVHGRPHDGAHDPDVGAGHSRKEGPSGGGPIERPRVLELARL